MKDFLNATKQEYKEFKSELQQKKLRKSIVAFFFALLTSITVLNRYSLIICGVISIFFSILALVKKQKFAIVSIIIVLLCGGYSLYRYYSYEIYRIAPYEGTNVMIGTWSYNENGGVYIFNKDNSYYQYMNENREDNYCTGTYVYQYGYDSEEGIFINEDEAYHYYSLGLNSNYCIINGIKSENEEYDKNMIFGYDKNNLGTGVIVNINAKSFSTITRTN